MIKDLTGNTFDDVLKADNPLPMDTLSDFELRMSVMQNYYRKVFQNYGKMYVIMEDQQIDDDFNLMDVTTEAKAFPATSLLHEAVGRGWEYTRFLQMMVRAFKGITVRTEEYKSGSTCDLGQALDAIITAVGSWDVANALTQMGL